MKNQKIRLSTVVGATMALVMAGTAAVSAAGPRDDDRGFGRGQAGIGARQGAQKMPGIRGGMHGGMRGVFEDLERREVTLQTADGTTVQRIEQGVVDSASDASLSFALGSGEAVTVTIDEDTQIVAFEEQTVERGRRSRQRMVPTEVEAADLEAGVEIVVWSDFEDGSDFVAERVVIQPLADEEPEEMTETEAEAAATVEETTTEDAAATDA